MLEDIIMMNDKVVARKVSDDKTAGGIYIPETVKGAPFAATISVGQGYRNRDKTDWIPLGVNTGDLIAYAPGSEIEVEIGGEKLIVLREADILGVLE